MLRLPRRVLRVLLVILLVLLVEPAIHQWLNLPHRPLANLDDPFFASCQEPPSNASAVERERAVLVMLARNRDLEGVLRSVKVVEDKFNRWFGYPWLFLNEQPFSTKFKRRVRDKVSGEAKFEVIPEKSWGFPKGTDVAEAKKSLERQDKAGVLYGGNASYHHMCRFYSGDFFLLPALRPYRYYWRIEPSIDLHCSLTYDPFRQMSLRGKVYGWTLALWELRATVPSLFRAASEWKSREGVRTGEMWRAIKAPEWTPWVARLWKAARRAGEGTEWWLRDAWGEKWNACHYWSNFEIGDLDFFRGERYQSFYRHLLKKGGFYHERWGDAPVHSLAVAMLLQPHQIHHFEDVGYQHDSFWTCPANAPGGQLPGSKTLGSKGKWDAEQKGGIGCRCSCPQEGRARMNIQDYCVSKLKAPTKAPAFPFGRMGL